MMKKTICSVVRILEMAVALIILQKTYQIGLLGCLLVALTGLVCVVTAHIERIE